MRISDNTAAYHNIIWFARDNNGNIIFAESHEGSCPEFVLEDASKTERLALLICAAKAVDRNREPAIDIDNLAARGFYCYKNDDHDGFTYRLQKTPTNPMNFDDLPETVRRLLKNQKLPFDAAETEEFMIVR